MLSYQHAYHAGNLADVHKHAALAWMLARLTAKPKPLTYIETHAGRGLYDLSGMEATKTGEFQPMLEHMADTIDGLTNNIKEHILFSQNQLAQFNVA